MMKNMVNILKLALVSRKLPTSRKKCIFRGAVKLFGVMVIAPIFYITGGICIADTIELDTTTIKGNSELPKYLYVVPWQDKEGKRDKQRKLKLHNLYGDLFDPVMPANNLVEEVVPVSTEDIPPNRLLP